MDLVLFRNMPISVRSKIRDMTQWLSLLETHYRSVMFGLLTKLNKLKSEVQSWEKVKKIKDNEEIEKLDLDLKSLSNVVDDFYFSVDRKEKDQDLETKQGDIL